MYLCIRIFWILFDINQTDPIVEPVPRLLGGIEFPLKSGPGSSQSKSHIWIWGMAYSCYYYYYCIMIVTPLKFNVAPEILPSQ